MAACSVTVSERLGYRSAADVDSCQGRFRAADSQMTGVASASLGPAQHDILNTEASMGGGLKGACVHQESCSLGGWLAPFPA